MLATAAMIGGCVAAERPGPAGDSTDESASALSDDEIVAARVPPVSCVPRSYRICHRYFRDASGQLHCPESAEICRPDGRGYFACGEHLDGD
jgi:hypothetical protein